MYSVCVDATVVLVRYVTESCVFVALCDVLRYVDFTPFYFKLDNFNVSKILL